MSPRRIRIENEHVRQVERPGPAPLGTAPAHQGFHLCLHSRLQPSRHGPHIPGTEGRPLCGPVDAFFALLGVAGLAGVYAEVSPLIGKRGRAGLGVAIVGLALLFVAGVMQYWIPGTSFNSPLSLSGLYLSLLALLVATFGLIVAGLDIRRTDPLPRWRSVVLIIGLFAVPTILFRSWVVMNSPDTFSWRLLYVGAFVPWELCWAWLGYVLVAASRNPGHALPSRPQ